MSYKKISQYYEIGDHIQRALDEINQTQVWLAEELTKKAHKEGYTDKKFDRTHVNKWCKNRNVPSTQYMEWIADILGYSVKEIVSGEFGSKKDRSITINDPIIKEEIERVLKIVDSACEGSGLTETERKRYKALIKSKIRTILEYATG